MTSTMLGDSTLKSLTQSVNAPEVELRVMYFLRSLIKCEAFQLGVGVFLCIIA
jgi:hypothetical protein